MKKFRIRAAVIALGSMTLLSACASSEKAASAGTDEVKQEAQAVNEPETKKEAKAQDEPKAKQKTEAKQETEAKKETEVKKEAEAKQELETKEETQAADAQEPAEAAQFSVSENDFAVMVNGTAVCLGGDMRNYTDKLGTPDDYGEAKSCVEDGTDKVYTYGGVVVYTYITDGADLISLVEVTGSEPLSSGIHIGSTKEEAIAQYGSVYTEAGDELLYELGDKTLGLQIQDGKVSFMELF